MRTPVRGFLTALIFAAAFALAVPSALAEDAAPKKDDGKLAIHINIPPELQKAEEQYRAAAKSLTAEQQAKLKALEEEYMATVEYDMQAIHAGMELKHCAAGDTAIAKSPGKYQPQLGVLRGQMQAQAAGVRQRLREKIEREALFIDQNLLGAHYAFSMTMMLQLGAQVGEAAYQNGGFQKTDCAKLQQRLDAAMARGQGEHGGGPPPAPAGQLAQLKADAEKGVPEAMVTLGMLHITGEHVEKDAAKGLSLLTRAAEGGYERAQFLLGLALGTDMLGIDPDREKAKHWLGKAAAQGNKKAAGLLAQIDSAEPPPTMDELKKKAEGGDAGAQYELGGRYAHGLGMEKNAAEGRKWTLLAAGQGHPLAQSDLSVMLLGDNRVEEALVWMTKAAEAGVVNSQYELGTIYRDGRLVKQDRQRAALWLGKAAEAGDSRAAQALQGMGK